MVKAVANTIYLFILGLLDLALEYFGASVTIHPKYWTHQATDTPSLILDGVKALCVLVGFAIAFIAANGMTKSTKEKLLHVLLITKWIILAIAAIVAFIIAIRLLMADPIHNIVQPLVAAIFFEYATIKFFIFLGFCTFLRIIINEAPETADYNCAVPFRYVPVNLLPDQGIYYAGGYYPSLNH